MRPSATGSTITGWGERRLRGRRVRGSAGSGGDAMGAGAMATALGPRTTNGGPSPAIVEHRPRRGRRDECRSARSDPSRRHDRSGGGLGSRRTNANRRRGPATLPATSHAQARPTIVRPGVARLDDLDPAGQVHVGRGGEERASIRVIPAIESANARIVEPAPDRQAPSAPAARAASTSAAAAGRRPRGTARGAGRRSAGASRSKRPVARPATPTATAPRLATASASGTVAGQRGAHLVGRQAQLRDEQDGPQVARRIEPDRLDAVGRRAPTRRTRRAARPRRCPGGPRSRVARRSSSAVDSGSPSERVAGQRARRPSPPPTTRGRAPAGCWLCIVDPPADAVRELAAGGRAGRPRGRARSGCRGPRSARRGPRPRRSARSRRGSSRGPRARSGWSARARRRGSRSRRRGSPTTPGTSTVTSRPSSSASQCATIVLPTSPARRRPRRPSARPRGTAGPGARRSSGP